MNVQRQLLLFGTLTAIALTVHTCKGATTAAGAVVVAALAIWIVPLLLEIMRTRVLLSRLPQAKGHWAAAVNCQFDVKLLHGFCCHNLHFPKPLVPDLPFVLLGVTEGIAAPHRIHRVDQTWSWTYGPIAAFRVLHVPIVLITDPVLIHKITARETQATKSEVYNALDLMASNKGFKNLLTMDTQDDDWKLARRGLAPAFAPKHIRQAFHIVSGMALRLCEELRKRGTEQYIDMDNMAQRETIDVISSWGFGVEVGCIQGRNNLMTDCDVLRDMQVIVDECNKQIVIPLRDWVYRWLAGGARVHACFQRFYEFTYRMLDRVKELHDSGALDPDCVGGHLLRLKDGNGQPCSAHQLAAHVGILFFAGFDTTGHTIAYTLYFLCKHPEAQAKVAQELEQHGLLQTPQTPQPRELQYEDLAKLRYLQNVIKESMRLLPVVAGVGRKLTQDTMVEGFLLPKNITLALSTYAMHINCWEDGNKFLPDRWVEPAADVYISEQHNMAKVLPQGQYTATVQPLGHTYTQLSRTTAAAKESGQGPRTNGVMGPEQDYSGVPEGAPGGPRRFLPFQQGPRDCIGQALAKASVPATLATLLSRFTFQLDPAFDPESLDCMATTMRPAQGIPLRCTPRLSNMGSLLHTTIMRPAQGIPLHSTHRL